MKVNGQTIRLEKKLSLDAYLETQAIDRQVIAVERNGEIVPRKFYAETWLNDEDTLEIVHFVGGG